METPHADARLHVVIAQGQSHHPAKRALEEQLATRIAQIPHVTVTVVPHLYDLAPDGPVFSHLRTLSGPLAVFAWMYERATRWILDRYGVRGLEGETSLKNEADEPDDADETDAEADESAASESAVKPRVLDDRPPPHRPIYCFDLRLRQTADDFVQEIQRIAGSLADNGSIMPPVDRAAGADRLTEDEPGSKTDTVSSGNGQQRGELTSHGHVRPELWQRFVAAGDQPPATFVARLQEEADRRWYPVIDYSRCTNCMECIDFCLFGVYGVDASQTILVEQPDNCRKGCPACSRVCPENAIIFPQHKSPAIAGAPAAVGGLKIDLSRLFGGDPLELAVRERDEQLILAGRQAVGMSTGIPKRQSHKPAAPADDLDKLIDKLDELDL